MGIQAPSQVKFGIIYDCIKNDNNVLSISYMCEIAGVSRSGFYEWLKAAPTREQRDDRDRKDFELILLVQNRIFVPKAVSPFWIISSILIPLLWSTSANFIHLFVPCSGTVVS